MGSPSDEQTTSGDLIRQPNETAAVGLLRGSCHAV